MVIEFVMESQSNKARTLDVLHVASRPTFEGEQSNLRLKKKTNSIMMSPHRSLFIKNRSYYLNIFIPFTTN